VTGKNGRGCREASVVLVVGAGAEYNIQDKFTVWIIGDLLSGGIGYCQDKGTSGKSEFYNSPNIGEEGSELVV